MSAGFALLLWIGAAMPAQTPPPADDRLLALAADEYRWHQSQLPASEDVPQDQRMQLPDIGPAAQAAKPARWDATARALVAIDPATLSAGGRTNLAVDRGQIALLRNEQRYRDYEKPLTSDISFWGDVAETARGSFRTEADYRSYLAMLRDLPRYYDQQIGNMRARFRRGFTPTAITLKGRDNGVAQVVDAAPTDSIFYLPFRTMPAQMPAATQAALRAQAQATIARTVGEGWALYCEALGEDMGMYDTPYDRFGMLGYQMGRAGRLVVDTGIHTQGWSRERAQAYLRDNTALAEHEIVTEVDRYIAWPGQAPSYYIGQIAFRDGRAKAERALGERFDIRAFHDAVLALGVVPLPVIDQRVDQFITEGGKGPYAD